MKKLSRAQFLSTAAPLLTLSSAGLMAQGGDTPIIIADGSLRMNSAVPWRQFGQDSPRRRAHPRRTGRLTTIDVRLASGTNTIAFNNQQGEVVITYAGTEISLSTGPNGRGLRIDTEWGRFKPGSSDNELLHENQESKISRVVVRREGQNVLDQAAGGGTQISLHYN